MDAKLLDQMSVWYGKQAEDQLARIAKDCADFQKEIEHIVNRSEIGLMHQTDRIQSALANFTRGQIDRLGIASKAAAQAEAFAQAAKDE